MSNKRKAGRRERLLARKRPALDYPLAVVDDTDAVAEMHAAKDALDLARLREDVNAERAVAEAEARLAAAREAVEECYEPVPMTALLPKDFEALISEPEYAPRDGTDERWNADTFPRACFLACVDASGEMTAEDWDTFITENLAQGEREALFLAAIGLNARWPSGSIPNV